ncbi:riboflavin synthase, partial [Klebsiella aerogenes]|nr:riboflavin synthase [Klebsiella aerogenes]
NQLGVKTPGEKGNIEIDTETTAVVDTVERVLAAKEAAQKSAEE